VSDARAKNASVDLSRALRRMETELYTLTVNRPQKSTTSMYSLDPDPSSSKRKKSTQANAQRRGTCKDASTQETQQSAQVPNADRNARKTNFAFERNVIETNNCLSQCWTKLCAHVLQSVHLGCRHLCLSVGTL